MSIFYRAIRKLLIKTFGMPKIERAITRFADYYSIDLVRVAYNEIGILNYEDFEVSGESMLSEVIFPMVLSRNNAVAFDVGANAGDVALSIAKNFPNAAVFAFEPNPITFQTLQNRLQSESNATCLPMGLGATDGIAQLHCYRKDEQSGHASIYKGVFKLYEGYGIDGTDDLVTHEFKVSTIDGICTENRVAVIDFLKIDVEGHEMEVLKGARRMIESRSIKAIQFEFNECNVLSRVFLKDFYDLLAGYKFFRLHPDGLISLGQYAARHEIFQYQNILALETNLAQEVMKQPEHMA